ncbi:MAG: hypothetical protein EOM26_03720 [Alphaproteobacteria bacterium]|nr:hypothetical protein [Alphaproteobacteria bacterium]
MTTYNIQHRIHTLALFYPRKGESYPEFELDGIRFSHWLYNFTEGHKTRFWLAEKQIEANDFRTAYAGFYKSIRQIIAQISLLSQCYNNFYNEPFLIHKQNSDIAYFRYTRKSNGVPLAIEENFINALEKLEQKQINAEFFYYWNDMLNVTGYSAKLLLICSALEALAKSPINPKGKKGKQDFFKGILGEDLQEKIWKTDSAVRNRLVHGEYFNEETDNENYLDQIYDKVVEYLNDYVFEEKIIRRVTNPQRHPDNNKEGGSYFIKRIDKSPSFDLKSLVEGCDIDFCGYLGRFELLPGNIGSSY